MVGRAGIEAGAPEEARTGERVEGRGAQIGGGLAQGGGGGAERGARGRTEVEGAPEPEEVQVLGGLFPRHGGGASKLPRAPASNVAKQLAREGDGGKAGAIGERAKAQKLSGQVEGRGGCECCLRLSHASRPPGC